MPVRGNISWDLDFAFVCSSLDKIYWLFLQHIHVSLNPLCYATGMSVILSLIFFLQSFVAAFIFFFSFRIFFVPALFHSDLACSFFLSFFLNFFLLENCKAPFWSFIAMTQTQNSETQHLLLPLIIRRIYVQIEIFLKTAVCWNVRRSLCACNIRPQHYSYL
jgi:hypothetical protein